MKNPKGMFILPKIRKILIIYNFESLSLVAYFIWFKSILSFIMT